MAKAIGIQAHPLFKLGKAAAVKDPRNLKLATLLKVAPKPPVAFDFDLKHPGIPTPMFANDQFGDCVIAGRAHQTLRFEKIEQGSDLMIKDADVIKEYLKETGGADTGLEVLDSIKLWRKSGWKVGRHIYKINAFAQVDWKNADEVRRAIFANIGIGLGVQLPTAAKAQMQTGQAWDITSGAGGKAGSWGGHFVYLPAYNKIGPVCVTWGRKQQMTWAWMKKYADEAYAVFDAQNSFKKALIDGAKIQSFLATLS
jgi:hypothetical protein